MEVIAKIRIAKSGSIYYYYKLIKRDDRYYWRCLSIEEEEKNGTHFDVELIREYFSYLLDFYEEDLVEDLCKN